MTPTDAIEWPLGALNLGPVVANTVILAAAGILMAGARRASATGPPLMAARRELTFAAVLGLAFVGLKIAEYASKLNHGLGPSTSPYYALYFLVTGIHTLHVAAGAAVAGYLGHRGAEITGGDVPRFANRVRLTAYFWYLVNFMWLVILLLLYLS